MKYKFKVGDKVKIVDFGMGCSPECKNEVVEILQLGLYKDGPGYRITKTKEYSNATNGAHGGFIGEKSFELVKEHIPEYLECINIEGAGSYGILGRIYKFEKVSGPSWIVVCNLKCGLYDAGSILYFCPDQFKPSTKEAYEAQAINTYGLKIGDVLKKEVLNAWGKEPNFIASYRDKFEHNTLFLGDRVIEKFEIKNGVTVFRVSDTAYWYGRAEGFKEFSESFNKKESKYEIGKWYKYTASYLENQFYAKYSSWQDVSGRFYYDEIINVGENIHIVKHDWSSLSGLPVLLEDLTEIQQYLPDGHPDKITQDPFVVGKLIKDLPIIDKPITCYEDGEGIKVFNAGAVYNLKSEFSDRKITKVTKDYFEVLGFGAGWFSKKEAMEDPRKKETMEKDYVGRYVKALKDAPISISPAKKGDIFKIISQGRIQLCKDGTTWTAHGIENYFGIFLELLPEDYRLESVQLLSFEQFGIDPTKLYDRQKINDWQCKGHNRWDGSWNNSRGGADTNRTLSKIGYKDGVPALYVSGTSNTWIRAEGFIEFYYEKEKLNPEDYIEEAKRMFPAGTVFNNSNLIPDVINDQAVSSNPKYRKYGEDEILVSTHHGADFTIWKNGEWANLISQDQEFVHGEYYSVDTGYAHWIIQFDRIEGKNLYTLYSIVPQNKSYYKGGIWFDKGGIWFDNFKKYKFRKATKEEIEHIKACQSANRYVDYPKEQKEWEPKVGDWAYVIKTGNYDYRLTDDIGVVFLIEEVSGQDRVYLRPKKGSSTGICKEYCRKALPHEIPETCSIISTSEPEDVIIQSKPITKQKYKFNEEEYDRKDFNRTLSLKSKTKTTSISKQLKF